MKKPFGGARDKSNRTYEEKLEQEARIEQFEQRSGHQEPPALLIDTTFFTHAGEALVVGYYEQEGLLTDLGQVDRVFREHNFVLEYDLIEAYEYAGVVQVFPTDHFTARLLAALGGEDDPGAEAGDDSRRYVQLVLATSKEELEADTEKLAELIKDAIDALRAKVGGEKHALKYMSKKRSSQRWGTILLPPDLFRAFEERPLKKDESIRMDGVLTAEDKAFLEEMEALFGDNPPD